MPDDEMNALHKHQPKLSKRSEFPIRKSDQVYFAEEQKGCHGYVEWEKYPDKAKRAAEILSKHKFAGVSSLDIDVASACLIEIISCSVLSFN